MEPGIEIRRRSDGSIDIAHYETLARAERIATVRRCVRLMLTLPRCLAHWLARPRHDARTQRLSPETELGSRAT
jgi:hypothetical protein